MTRSAERFCLEYLRRGAIPAPGELKRFERELAEIGPGPKYVELVQHVSASTLFSILSSFPTQTTAQRLTKIYRESISRSFGKPPWKANQALLLTSAFFERKELGRAEKALAEFDRSARAHAKKQNGTEWTALQAEAESWRQKLKDSRQRPSTRQRSSRR